MTRIQKHLDLLGRKAEDKITGFNGVITCISFNLYGCIQAIIHPGIDKDGKLRDQNWFDVGRLNVTGEYPVMSRPDFENDRGPAEKPGFTKA